MDTKDTVRKTTSFRMMTALIIHRFKVATVVFLTMGTTPIVNEQVRSLSQVYYITLYSYSDGSISLSRLNQQSCNSAFSYCGIVIGGYEDENDVDGESTYFQV